MAGTGAGHDQPSLCRRKADGDLSFEGKMRKRVDAAELPCSEDHIVLGPGGDGCR